MTSRNVVEVDKDYYVTLCAAYRKLEALEAAGVDSWEGYDYAMENFFAEDEGGVKE